MVTAENLMAVIGASVDSDSVRALISADGLMLSSEPDYEEGEVRRFYLSNPAVGYQIMYCQGHVHTVFLYVISAEGFESFQGSLPGELSAHATRQEVLQLFGTPQRSGEAVTIAGLGRQGAWDRFLVGNVCIHFQYTGVGERIRLVTLMVGDKAA